MRSRRDGVTPALSASCRCGRCAARNSGELPAPLGRGEKLQTCLQNVLNFRIWGWRRGGNRPIDPVGLLGCVSPSRRHNKATIWRAPTRQGSHASHMNCGCRATMVHWPRVAPCRGPHDQSQGGWGISGCALSLALVQAEPPHDRWGRSLLPKRFLVHARR
jgi:hypothetical protein